MTIDINKLKSLLEAKQAELRESLEMLIKASPSAAPSNGMNRDPVDKEEAAVDVNETEDAWFIRMNQEALLAEVEKALTRMDQGTYGLCVQCKQPIPEKRLEILPWAACDVTCQEQQDVRAMATTLSEERYTVRERGI